MAKSKFTIRCVLDDLDVDVEIEPEPGESGFKVLQQSVKGLKDAGAQPRPQPQPYRGGGGWQGGRKPVEIAPGVKCPKCGGGMILKEGTRADGTPYKGYACVKPRETCGGWLKAA